MFARRSSAVMTWSTLALWVALCVATTIGCGGSKSVSTEMPAGIESANALVGDLTKEVPDLSQNAAILGGGSLMGLAKAKMTPDQFAQVSHAVPGTTELIDEANKKGMPKNLNTLADVMHFTGAHGISPQQMTDMTTALTKTVEDKVPGDVGKAFEEALK